MQRCSNDWDLDCLVRIAHTCYARALQRGRFHPTASRRNQPRHDRRQRRAYHVKEGVDTFTVMSKALAQAIGVIDA